MTRTLSEIKEWWINNVPSVEQLKARPPEEWFPWQSDNPLHPDFRGSVDLVSYLPQIFI